MSNYRVKTKPYAHQEKAIDATYGKEAFALFMEQGTGKTKVAIDIACNLYFDGKIDAVMLIAPNGVHTQWIDEQLPIHSSSQYQKFQWSTKTSNVYLRSRDAFIKQKSNKLKWFAINVDAFSVDRNLPVFVDYLRRWKTFLIVDESTRIKNPSAKRTNNIIYGLCDITKQGKVVTAVKPYSKYRAVLTGTMVTNSPYDLWSMFTFLHNDYFGINFYAFKARYGIEVTDLNPYTHQKYKRKIRISEMNSVRNYLLRGKDSETIAAILGISESSVAYIKANPNLSEPYKRLDELRESIQPISFIVRKDDCLDLPPKVHSVLPVIMSPDQKRLYKEVKDNFIAEYAGKLLTVQHKIVIAIRLQQITGGFFPHNEDDVTMLEPIGNSNPKITALTNDIYETGDEAIIIWARFVCELRAIYAELVKAFPDKNIRLYYGGVKKESRKQIIDDFQKGYVDILVANVQTAGVGLNLQRAHIQYFYSNSYSMEDREQAEDRSHRIGQKQSVLYKDIVVKGTIDETVCSVLKSKKDLLDYFRDTPVVDIIAKG